jgi:hypothetical protein
MEIIYGTTLNFDDMLKIMKKIDKGDKDYTIYSSDYKEYTSNVNDYINSNTELKKIKLQIYPVAEIEAGDDGDLWIIGYRAEYLGYHSILRIPNLSDKIKKDIDKDNTLFSKHFRIDKQEFDFIIIITDNNLII